MCWSSASICQCMCSPQQCVAVVLQVHIRRLDLILTCLTVTECTNPIRLLQGPWDAPHGIKSHQHIVCKPIISLYHFQIVRRLLCQHALKRVWIAAEQLNSFLRHQCAGLSVGSAWHHIWMHMHIDSHLYLKGPLKSSTKTRTRASWQMQFHCLMKTWQHLRLTAFCPAVRTRLCLLSCLHDVILQIIVDRLADFRYWQHHSQVLRMSRPARDAAIAQWSTAVAFWEVNLITRLLQRWRGLAPVQLSRATTLWAQSATRSSFWHWRGAIEHQKRQHRSAVAHHNSTKLLRSLALWREASRVAKQMALAGLHLKRGALRRCFAILRAAATRMRVADAAASGHAARGAKRRGLQFWRSMAASAALHRVAEVALHKLCHRRRATETLMLWQAGTQAALWMRSRMHRALARWRRRALMVAMEIWRTRVQAVARKEERMQVCDSVVPTWLACAEQRDQGSVVVLAEGCFVC